jgi:hypothetical protein
MSDRKTFAQLCGSLENAPHDEVMALGYMMRDWLEAAIVDSGTGVDQGAGLGMFDLWATVGGKKVFITIKEQS